MSAVGFVSLQEQTPPTKGYYLALQVRDDFSSQWVRHWDGERFDDPREAKYGPITHWSPLPPYPDGIKKKAHAAA